jgi:hypothetical protein
MTLMRMRQHIGAAVWHLERAAEEAPTADALPLPFRALLVDRRVANIEAFGIDRGHVVEQSRAETHLVPDAETSDEVEWE